MRISLVNAGHPALFVTGADEEVRRVGTPQLLLGVMDKVTYVPEEHVLDRGELMVALTDGVLVIKYMFGFRGDILIAGAVDEANCESCTAEEIEPNLASLLD